MSKFLQLCREGFLLLLRGSLEQPALAAEEQYLALLDYRPPIPRG